MASARHSIHNINIHPAAPLSVITVTTSLESPTSTFGPFTLDRYALAWIVEGGGLTTLDDVPYPTSPGSVLSMLPGMSLRHDWGASRSLQAYIVFDLEPPPAELGAPQAWPRARQLAGRETFLVLWRYLLAIEHGAPSSANLLPHTVELLLRMFVSGALDGEAPTSAALPRSVEQALDFMRTRIANGKARFELAAVARAAGVTPQHLCRIFRHELDASPLECAHLMRIEQAVSLLERTDTTLAELAERFGYSSAFHFSRVFKQICGTPPSDYRRAFLAGRTTRPGGLVFRHHRLRRYIYETGPGRSLVQS